MTDIETWQTKFIIVKNYRFLISRHFQLEIIRLSSATTGHLPHQMFREIRRKKACVSDYTGLPEKKKLAVFTWQQQEPESPS